LIINALVAFRGRPLFLFSPKGTSFAAGGGLQNFNRIALPTRYLQTYSFKKFGQLQNPFFHLDSVLDKVNLHIPN
jgi:hypothetical protein